MPQIISEDITWTSGQIINLNDELQIAPNVTLTIEDGVVVNGNGHSITVFGNFISLNAELTTTTFNDVTFSFGSDSEAPGNISINDAHISNGYFLPATGNASYGNFSISHSTFTEVSGFYIWYPTSNSTFTNNLFIGSQGLSIGVRDAALLIRNNTFFDAQVAIGGSSTIAVWANYGDPEHISIIGNNFLEGLQTHLELQAGYPTAKLYSFENYFLGSTLSDAEDAVLDAGDSLTRGADILLESHQSTPNLTAPPLPSVSVSPINGSSSEGTNQNTQVSFIATLSEPSTQTVSVRYATQSSSAIAGEDFVATTGTLTFAPGSTTETFSVEIVGDTENESDEIFRVELSDPIGAVLDLSGTVIKAYQALHTIRNDDDLTNVNENPTGAVIISGTASEGNELTAITSTIADTDGLGSFSYQWLRDGNPITGAISRIYNLVNDDIGEPISVRITYTDGGGTTETLTSAETAAVTSAIPPETTIPTDAADSIIGTDLSEIIAARGGNDFITASKGNDRIDGGLGIDTVLYDGDQNSYTVTLTSSGVQVRDRRTDGNGTDTLTNTEFLVFDAGPYAEFNLTQFGGAASLNEEAFKGFIELYIAYYNRAPDAIGLNFWGTAYANGTSMEEMATLFAGQSETLRFYPENTSNAEFAEAVYNNVLGRTPDQAGFDFWVNSLNSGFVSRDQFILEVLGGVQDGSTDRVYLDNKVNVGAYFAVHKGLSDTSEAAIAMALYDGSNLSLQSVKQTVDSFHAAALDPLNGDFLLPLVGVLADPFA